MLDTKRNGQSVKDLGWNDKKEAVMEKIIRFKADTVNNKFSFQTVDIEFFFIEATFENMVYYI